MSTKVTDVAHIDPSGFRIKKLKHLNLNCTKTCLRIRRYYVSSYLPTREMWRRIINRHRLSWNYTVKFWTLNWHISHLFEPRVLNHFTMHEWCAFARPPRHRHPRLIKASSFSSWHTLQKGNIITIYLECFLRSSRDILKWLWCWESRISIILNISR